MIRENLERIRQRIAVSCAKAGRNPQEIILVAASKGRNLAQIREALGFGVCDIGENRVQEALEKYMNISKLHGSKHIEWHMIGHLQTNKVKEAIKIFGLIQSVDSVYLAGAIDAHAAKINKVQDILLEVNTSLEATKYGFKQGETIEAVEEIARLKNVHMKGLMTIAPIMDDTQRVRSCFRMLRELRDRINDLQLMNLELNTLSMGMSNDFEVAIEEGATMIRIGKAIFEG